MDEPTDTDHDLTADSGPVTLHYVRFGVPGSREHATLDDALDSAANDIDSLQAAPVRIDRADGTTLLAGADLERALARKFDEIEAAEREESA